MAMNFNILPMQAQHTESIAGIEKVCFGKSAWSKESIDYQLTNDCAYFFSAVSDDGKVLGYGGSHIAVDECYIDNIAVASAFRGEGIGKALTQKLIENARKKRCAFISLEVRVSNLVPVSLYEKLGFVTLGRRKNFYSHPTEDALIMTLYFSR